MRTETTWSPLYKLNLSSPLNEPWYKYARGGQGMHEGLGEDDRYMILTRLKSTDNYVFVNITTGRVVTGVHPLERFTEM
jgi:hypothetical protein